MLSTTEAASVASAAAWLAQCAEPAARAHGAALAAVVEAHMATLASMATAQAARRAANPTGQRGRPTSAYRVAMDPLWDVLVPGAAAAHTLVNETLKEHGGSGTAPTLNSLRVQLSTKGAWTRMVETDNGTYALTVTRAAWPETPNVPETPQTEPEKPKRKRKE